MHLRRNSPSPPLIPNIKKSPTLGHLELQVSNQHQQRCADIQDKVRQCPRKSCRNWPHLLRCTRMPLSPKFWEPRLFRTRLPPPIVGFSRTRISPAQLSCRPLTLSRGNPV